MKTFFLFALCLALAASQTNAQWMVDAKGEKIDGRSAADLKEFKIAMGKLANPDFVGKARMELPRAFFKAAHKLLDTKPQAPKFKKFVYKFKIGKPDGKAPKTVNVNVKVNGQKIKIPLPADAIRSGEKMKLKVKVHGKTMKVKLNGKKYLIRDVNNVNRKDFVMSAVKKATNKIMKDNRVSDIMHQALLKMIPETPKTTGLAAVKEALLKLVDKSDIKKFKKALVKLVKGDPSLSSVTQALANLVANTKDLSEVRRALFKIIPQPDAPEISHQDVVGEPGIVGVAA